MANQEKEPIERRNVASVGVGQRGCDMPDGNGQFERFRIVEGSRAVVRPGIDLGRLLDRDPDPVDLVRPADLVHLRCSFINLRIDASGAIPTLVRRHTNRAAFLVFEWAPQHVTEQAFFESAGKDSDGNDLVPKAPSTEAAVTGESLEEIENDERAKLGGSTTNPPLHDPPVLASMSGTSRVAYRMTNEQIDFTTAGLLAAAGELPMSVVDHATPPPELRWPWFDADLSLILATSAHAFVDEVLSVGARLPATWRSGRAASSTSRFARDGRVAAGTAQLLARFGPEAAGAFVASSSLTVDRGVKPIDVRAVRPGRLMRIVRPPSPPGAHHTSIELPWRLLISPSVKGGWAHSVGEVEHDGRVELWHSRLGVRRTDDAGVTVDEYASYYRTVRAVWARDFEELQPNFGFAATPASSSFPNADGHQDRPPDPPFRMSLNSRDRMMLVHETSNFTLPVRPTSRAKWVPPTVAVNRLMLTSQGAWLNSRLGVPTLPEERGLTLEEWKHIATLGRDHEVKVVYAGFLMPFGHRASLVKVSQRKFGSEIDGDPAFLYQRMFVIVREPLRQFRTSNTTDGAGHRLDLSMPFTSVQILTEITPDIDLPKNEFTSSGGYMFSVHVGNRPFGFKTVATDVEGNVVEFDAPMYFVEWDRNEKAQVALARQKYNQATVAARRVIQVGGQRIAYARGVEVDDTALATKTLKFRVVGGDSIDARAQTLPRWEPKLEVAGAVIPTAQALAGVATVTELDYPDTYLKNGFTGGEVFLKAAAAPSQLDFGGQGDRSGGFVTPSLAITGLSRITGPIGGNISEVESGKFAPQEYFGGLSAKLFGLVPLADLIPDDVFEAGKVPTFAAQALNIATTLASNVQRFGDLAGKAKQAGGAIPALDAASDAVIAASAGVIGALDGLKEAGATAPTAALTTLGSSIQALVDEATAAADVIGETTAKQISAIGTLLGDQLSNVTAIAVAAQALLDFAQGFRLPETTNARLDWSTVLKPWPSAGQGAIFDPKGDKTLTLAVEVQAPTRPGGDPNVLISCSLPPIDLNLIGTSRFMIVHFTKMSFSLEPGKKPDVDIVFDPKDGLEFVGPLSFVETLREIIPFDGFSDPPYLDLTAEGVKAGFDLALPNLAVGVFSLENISLGAHVLVPFIDEPLEVGFNFCTRENPFRLTVSLFGGGGFFGVTLTPGGVRVLEMALEFGAAISVNFGVASGGIEVMAGIYIRMENDDATLTGYFRMRGEVDVLGLISASIELYMELTYETATGKAVGRAKITVEVEVLFFSASVSISAEKKFAGANGDPTFSEVMGLAPGAPPGTVRPWDTYCGAFA